MITSQLLLSLFLGYWLYTEFGEKKRLLADDLERSLIYSEDRVIDTLLATNIINPCLRESSSYKFIMIDSMNIDSSLSKLQMGLELGISHDTSMKYMSSSHDEIIMDKKVIAMIDRIDSSTSFSNEGLQSTITVQTSQDTTNKLLFQGVKVLVNSVGNFDVNENSIHTFFSSKVDTFLLMKIFQESVDNKYIGFNIKWESLDETELKDNKLNKLILKSSLFKNPYGVCIIGYNPYLIRLIGAQIAFALILLIITTLAFRVSYISVLKQRKLLAIKNDFISNITHELKTPVSTIKVALEALLDFNIIQDPKRTKEYLEMANSEMNRLDLLVNQVLNNSALKDGSSFISTKNINLNSLVNEVLFSIQSQINTKESKIIFDQSEESTMIEADKLHLHGVIVNLLDNSLKYSHERPEIKIDIIQNDKETKLIISDNGIGIPDEYIDKVFDKFFRVPKGNEHSMKGYGLGLNYASLVIKHHKGNILANCKGDNGCIFTITLPNKQ